MNDCWAPFDRGSVALDDDSLEGALFRKTGNHFKPHKLKLKFSFFFWRESRSVR